MVYDEHIRQRFVFLGGTMHQSYKPSYERSHALVVGINAYGALPPLATAVHDAEDVANTLTEILGFEVTLLRDAEATRNGILEHIQQLTRTNLDDRVLIYFAGHGMTRTTTSGDPVGLLVPYGVEPGQYEHAIEMDYLVDRSKYIPAKHVLFVLDACFSGLAVTRSTASGDRLLEDLMTRRAVQAIAAGQQDQLVADTFGAGGHSIFTGVLLNLLDQRSNLLTGNELGLHLQREVGRYSHSRQTPHYGHLLGSQGGDFVFWAEETVVELPAELRAAVDSPQVWMRQGAINELVRMLNSSNPEMAALARQELTRMAETDDSISVREAAHAALGQQTPAAPIRTTPPPAAQPAPEPVAQVSAPIGKPAFARKAPASPETTKTWPFFQRWWRVGAGLVAVFLFVIAFTLFLQGIWYGFLAIPFGVVGVDHALRRRWARCALFLLASLVWIASVRLAPLTGFAAGIVVSLNDFILSPFLIIWSIVDAVRNTDTSMPTVEADKSAAFFRRWWRVGMGIGVIALFVFALSTYEGNFVLLLLPLGILSIEHAIQRRWSRSIYFLAPTLAWLAWLFFQTDLWAYAAMILTALSILSSIIDATRDQYV